MAKLVNYCYCFIAFLTLSHSIVGTAAIDAECAGYPSGEITYFPDPYDCQKYYECYEGTLYVMACPNDLYWNQNAQVCDYKDNVDCSRGNQTTSIPKTTPKVTTPAGNDTNPDVLCQGYPVDEITYLPYPYDCQKYYECYGGKLYIMTCGDLYWNQKDEVCDYKENVDCTPSNSTTSAPPKTTTAKGTTKPNNDSTPDVQCQGYPTDQITYLPDPYDCQKYYECYGGELYVMSCGDLYWNQKAQVCDYKDNVDCTPSNSTTPTPKTTTTKGTTKPNNDSTPDVMCQGYPVDEITYLPYPDDCQKYYECYAGKLYVMSCGDLYWNQDAHVCDYKDNVNCTTDNVCNGYPTDQVTYLQYPYDCKKYYECTKGQAYIMTCPGELYWNQNITSCDKKDNVVCRSVTTALPTTTPKPTTPSDPATWCKGQADGTYFADPTDCASFYECLSGGAIKLTCPAGDYWNQNILNCDFEANVNCDVK